MTEPWEKLKPSTMKRLEVWLEHSATLQLFIEETKQLVEDSKDAQEFMDRLETEVINHAPLLLKPQILELAMACIYGADIVMNEEETS